MLLKEICLFSLTIFRISYCLSSGLLMNIFLFSGNTFAKNRALKVLPASKNSGAG
jgi:hypothetical protein